MSMKNLFIVEISKNNSCFYCPPINHKDVKPKVIIVSLFYQIIIISGKVWLNVYTSNNVWVLRQWEKSTDKFVSRVEIYQKLLAYTT